MPWPALSQCPSSASPFWPQSSPDISPSPTDHEALSLRTQLLISSVSRQNRLGLVLLLLHHRASYRRRLTCTSSALPPPCWHPEHSSAFGSFRYHCPDPVGRTSHCSSRHCSSVPAAGASHRVRATVMRIRCISGQHTSPMTHQQRPPADRWVCTVHVFVCVTPPGIYHCQRCCRMHIVPRPTPEREKNPRV